MPPKVKITKEDIISVSLNIVRQDGAEALNARSVANRLKCSTQPIYSNYPTMDKLKSDVIESAMLLYQEYNKRAVKNPDYPPYKAIGMYYILFAKEERELFKLLFMRDRSKEENQDDKEELEVIIKLVSESTGLSIEDAYLFHIQMWIYVHGIAVMIVTDYLHWDFETISKMLTDVYMGLIKVYKNKEDD